jgi:predicted DNA-binding protein
MNLFHEAKKVLDKDGKVNPLGPHGKSKLTGREISAYFRRNPVKDATIRKAVSVALDLEGAMTTAAKEIKKFYGDKVLKSKEVQFALKYANEGVIHEYDDISEGSFYGRDDLVKQFATPKNQKHLFIKLRKTDSKGTHGVSMKRKGNEDKIKKYKADGYKEVPVESVEEVVEESLNLLEKAYDANDVKKVKQLEKKFQALLKEVDKVMRGSGISAPAFSMVRGGIRKGLESIEKFYKIANAPKNLKNESINEVTQQEVNAVKKLSKDAEKMKKDYFKIAKMGDKELADGKYNSYYESILKMQQKVLALIGALNNKMRMESTNLMDTYRLIGEQKVEFLEEEKKLKFTNIKDKTLEKHLKAVTKKVGAKLEKISGGFAVSDTDMRGFTAVVDYIFDKSIKKGMLDGGGMSDVTMANENNNQMWEDAIEENIERGIMKKMRRGKVAKGMPR